MFKSNIDIKYSLTFEFFKLYPNLKLFLEKSFPEIYYHVQGLNSSQNRKSIPFYIFIDQNINKLANLLTAHPTGDARVKSKLNISQLKFVENLVNNGKIYIYLAFGPYTIFSFYITINNKYPLVLKLGEDTCVYLQTKFQPQFNDYQENISRSIKLFCDYMMNLKDENLTDYYSTTFQTVKGLQNRFNRLFLLSNLSLLKNVSRYQFATEQLYQLIPLLELFREQENVYYALFYSMFPEYDFKPNYQTENLISVKYKLIEQLNQIHSSKSEYGLITAAKIKISEDYSKSKSELISEICEDAEDELYSQYYINRNEWVEYRQQNDPLISPN